MNHRRRLKINTAYAAVAKIFKEGSGQDVLNALGEKTFNANISDTLSGIWPVNLMLALLKNEQLTVDTKIDLSMALLEQGFTLVNHYEDVMGDRGYSAMDYLTTLEILVQKDPPQYKSVMLGVNPKKHIKLLAAMIKVGGRVFVESGTEYMWFESPYERAERDFPYLLGENGGPFPVLERDLLGDPFSGQVSWSHSSHKDTLMEDHLELQAEILGIKPFKPDPLSVLTE